MNAASGVIALLAFLIAPTGAGAASRVHKCMNDGAVTYQSSPCLVGDKREQPTAAQLNAQRQKTLQRQPAAASAAAPAAVPVRAEPARGR